MKSIQIGVIGSMADKGLKKSLKQLASEIGQEIAKNNATLVFGFEGDFDSLSLIAAKEAETAGGKTIAFIWGNEKPDLQGLKSLPIVTGQNRGGGREFPLILSCDVIICISGGSGTLMEMTMAYQANIPIIALKNSGGWSQKLAGKFIDDRKRLKVIPAMTSVEAVRFAIREVQTRIKT
jgi:uncharacterized protein (TIGR00725 family)